MTYFWFLQSLPRVFFLVWEPQLSLRSSQRFQRCLFAQLAVAIFAVVALLEGKGSSSQLVGCGHEHLAEKLMLIVVIELLDKPVTPRLRHGNEPGLVVIVQTESNELTRCPRVFQTTEEGHGVVDLKIVWNAKTSWPVFDGDECIPQDAVAASITLIP